MMTRELEVSILAAPLGAIDRRALSQAWYSALRLAPQPVTATPRAGGKREGQVPARCGAAAAAPNSRGDAPCGRPQLRLVTPQTSARYGEPSPSAPSRSALAQRIERAFSEPRANPKRATFTLGRGNARVHVVLQTSGSRATLLAICRPELRPVVARALAAARLALAARGIDLCETARQACS